MPFVSYQKLCINYVECALEQPQCQWAHAAFVLHNKQIQAQRKIYDPNLDFICNKNIIILI